MLLCRYLLPDKMWDSHDERIALSADRILTICDGKLLRDEVLKGGE